VEISFYCKRHLWTINRPGRGRQGIERLFRLSLVSSSLSGASSITAPLRRRGPGPRPPTSFKYILWRTVPTNSILSLAHDTLWRDHRFKSWKQPLAEMQGKALYIRPKVVRPFPIPCASGSYVHRAALYILLVLYAAGRVKHSSYSDRKKKHSSYRLSCHHWMLVLHLIRSLCFFRMSDYGWKK
jgi:hypothetical protein